MSEVSAILPIATAQIAMLITVPIATDSVEHEAVCDYKTCALMEITTLL